MWSSMRYQLKSADGLPRKLFPAVLFGKGHFCPPPYWNTAMVSEAAVVLCQPSGDLEYGNNAENDGAQDRRAWVQW